MQPLQKKWYLLTISFIAGTSSLALEICAARLLAPHYGSSTIVWSSIIGIVLLTLSAGYYVGGKLAEWKLEIYILLRAILVCSLLTLLIPLFASSLLKTLTTISPTHVTLYLAGGSLLASFLLFGLPVFLLGMVSPYLLSLLAKQFGHIGNTSGQLLAISTLGGLLGSFLPTLVLIPSIGTTKTILVIGIVLVLVGLPGVIQFKTKSGAAVLVVITVLLDMRATALPPHVLAQAESAYQHIMVVDEGDDMRSMRFDAGFGYQSIYQKDKILTGAYYDYAILFPALVGNQTGTPKKVLILGVAGGTIPRQLKYFYGESVHIDAVEIDAQSTALAKKYMGLDTVPVTIYHEDGRQYLRSHETKYDVIYVDTYQNELQIPWTLTTREFWQDVAAHLNSSGVVGMNIAALGATDSSLVAAITNSAANVFPSVYSTPLTNHSNSNHLVLMAHDRVDVAQASALVAKHEELKPLLEYLTTHLVQKKYDSRALVLTDDKAPLEWLMAQDSLK